MTSNIRKLKEQKLLTKLPLHNIQLMYMKHSDKIADTKIDLMVTVHNIWIFALDSD